jgi:hypothetical protein
MLNPPNGNLSYHKSAFFSFVQELHIEKPSLFRASREKIPSRHAHDFQATLAVLDAYPENSLSQPIEERRCACAQDVAVDNMCIDES